MKDCVRFAPMIGARPGELSPDEARALGSHLAGCPSCRGFAADVAATDGLVEEALMARANARDFSPFVDQVMARVGAGAPVRRRGLWAWIGHHRRATAATLAPVLAALALIVYVRVHGGGSSPIAMVEISAEGDVTTILETADGPIVLLAEENGS